MCKHATSPFLPHEEFLTTIYPALPVSEPTSPSPTHACMILHSTGGARCPWSCFPDFVSVDGPLSSSYISFTAQHKHTVVGECFSVPRLLASMSFPHPLCLIVSSMALRTMSVSHQLMPDSQVAFRDWSGVFSAQFLVPRTKLWLCLVKVL